MRIHLDSSKIKVHLSTDLSMASSPTVLGSCDATEEVVTFVDAAGRTSSVLRHLMLL